MEMPPFNALKDSSNSESQWMVERFSSLEQLDKKQHRIELQEDTIRLMRDRQCGASSDKHSEQGELFNEAELISSEVKDAVLNTGTADKTLAKRGRKPIPLDLPRVLGYLDLSAYEKDSEIDTLYDVVKEELDIIPAKVQVLEYLQEEAVYRDDACERAIKSAPLPAHIIPRSLAGAGLLALTISGRLHASRINSVRPRRTGDL